MKRIILSFVVAFSLALNVSSQSTAIGNFYGHLPYNAGTSICLANNKIYAGTGPTLFTLDLEDNSVETFSKVNKLSDLGINALAYSEKYNTVIIGYSTGNIDLIVNNQIINIPDIERTSVIGFKSINEIYIEDEYAYLSTGFGIVKLDIQRQEIKETFLIGDDATNVIVNDLTFFNDTIYAATEKGIYFAPASSPNLANFLNWNKHDYYFDRPVNQIHANESEMIFNLSVEGYNQDTLVVYDGNNWNNLSIPRYFNEDIQDIGFENNSWVFSFTFIALIADKELTSTESIYTYFTGKSGMRPKQIIAGKSDDFWIIDGLYGLIHRKGGASFTEYAPTGPANYQAWEMKFHDNKLWVASGSLDASNANNRTKNGVYKYENNTWTSYNDSIMKSIQDIVTVAIHPDNSNHVFFGVHGKGLIETMNGESLIRYDNLNSGVSNWAVDWDDINVISGTNFDDNGVLWVVCSGASGVNVEHPLVAYDGTDWYQFNLDNKLISTPRTGDVMIDNKGYKWVSSRDNGIFVFDDNGTLSDEDDDRLVLLKTGESNGNLPTKLVNAVEEDNDGAIWIGTDEGLTVINNTSELFEDGVKADRIIIEQEGAFQYLLETDIIKCIEVDAGNRKWIGTASSGVYLVSEDGQETIHHFTTENSPMISNNIFDIEIFESTGEVFFATDEGIISYVGDATDGDAYNGPTYAYPNPVRPDYEGLIGIKGLVPNSEVKITDITGNVIYETMSEGTTATWDGNSLSGRRAQTGVYVVFSVSDDGSQKEVTKILFIN